MKNQIFKKPKYSNDAFRLFGVSIVDQEKSLIMQEQSSEVVDVDDHVSTILRLSPPSSLNTKKRNNLRQTISITTTTTTENPVLYNNNRELSPFIPVIFPRERVLLSQKDLEVSDVTPNLNRLFITNAKKLIEFLTEEERTNLFDVGNSYGVDVRVVDPNGEYHAMRFKFWHSVKMTVLKLGWKKFVIQNNLKAGDRVQLWGYRHNYNAHLHLFLNF